MVSECPCFALAAVMAKPFAKLFRQTKSSCKAGEAVRVGFGGIWGQDFCLFAALGVEERSEGSGGWQEDGNSSSQHQHRYRLQWVHTLRQGCL